VGTSDDQRSLFPSDPEPGHGNLDPPALWLMQAGPESDVVVSSRMRLARNIDGFRFKSRFADGEGDRLEIYLRGVLREVEPSLAYYSLNDLSTHEREAMFERHLVSHEHVIDDQTRGVAFNPDGTVSVMVNEEDHLRLQVFAPGLDLTALEATINDLDDRLARHVTFAFDERFGFRTSCPTNTGTGLRVSVMLHLPALAFRQPGARGGSGGTGGRERDIVRMHNAAQQLGLTVRGLFGESSRAEGDFFQISNQITLGKNQSKTIEDVHTLTVMVVDWERRNREAFLQEHRVRLEDHVWRAWALLTAARRISSSEALGHLSALRLGLQLKIIDQVDVGTIQRLMVTLRPGHLQLSEGRDLTPDDRDAVRAQLIRDTLSGSADRS
jgi:protein arginine kinase